MRSHSNSKSPKPLMKNKSLPHLFIRAFTDKFSHFKEEISQAQLWCISKNTTYKKLSAL